MKEASTGGKRKVVHSKAPKRKKGRESELAVDDDKNNVLQVKVMEAVLSAQAATHMDPPLQE